MQVIRRPIDEPAQLIHRDTGYVLVLSDLAFGEVAALALEELLEEV